MHNLIEYNNAWSKTSGSLWQYYRDEPALDNNEIIIDFLVNNHNSNLFRSKQKLFRTNRKRWHKRCWNNDSVELSK